jgi:hypothetical protein
VYVRIRRSVSKGEADPGPQKARGAQSPFSLLDFCTEGQLSEHSDAFGSQQTEWMTKFARGKRVEYSKSMLEHILIGFKPDVCLEQHSDELEARWPWESLERARQAVLEHGMVLEYDEPYWTKEMWDESVRGLRDMHYSERFSEL